jgi:hypothetical protein
LIVHNFQLFNSKWEKTFQALSVAILCSLGLPIGKIRTLHFHFLQVV